MLNQCTIDLIIEKKLPAHTVYEDDEFIAFLDIHPLFYGHTLLAPKNHYPTLYDLPPTLSSSILILTQKIGKAVELGMNAEGSFIAMNNVYVSPMSFR